MALIKWAHSTSGTWSSSGNWSGGVAPGPGDAVVIAAGHNGGASYGVTITSAVHVHSLLLDAVGALLEVGSETQAGSLSATDLTFTAGTLALSDGTLSGTVTAGQFFTFKFDYGYYDTSGGTLRNVTWIGNFEPQHTGIDNSNYLNIEGSLTLLGAGGSGAGTATLQNGASLNFIGTQTLNNATVTLGGIFESGTCDLLSSGNAAGAGHLTLGASLDIQVDSGAALLTDGTITNDGTILVVNGSFDGEPGSLSIAGKGVFVNAGVLDIGGSLTSTIGDLINTGTIDVTGGTLTLTQSAASTWSNTGTIDAAGGTVLFAGTVTAAQLQHFEASDGGTLGLLGTLVNTGSTLALGTASLPSLALDRGSVIEGGTVTGVADLALNGGTLSGVTWDGNLDLAGTFQSLTIRDGITLVPQSGVSTISLTGSYSTLEFEGLTKLSQMDIQLGSNGDFGGPAGLGIDSTLTLSSTVSLQLENGSGIGGDALVNDGTILGQPGGQVSINLQSFTNAGTLEFIQSTTDTYSLFQTQAQIGTFTNTGTLDIAGHITVEFKGEGLDPPSESWVSTGVVNVSDATLLLGGTLTTASLDTVHTSAGAVVKMDGTLLNSGYILGVGNSGSLGTLSLDGTIQGGVLSAAAGALRLVNGTLSGVTVLGNLDLSAASAELNVTNGLTMNAGQFGTVALTGDRSLLKFIGSQSLSTGIIDIGSASGASLDLVAPGTPTTLTLDDGAAIMQTGQYAAISTNAPRGVAKTLVNDNVISAGVAGGTFSVYGVSLRNAGGLSVSNGDTFQTALGTLTNAGTLMLAGTGSALDLGYDGFSAGFANSGILEITGGILNDGYFEQGQETGDSWVNTGTIDVSGGVLSLNIDYATAGLGTIVTSNGGYIRLDGDLDNAGATLTLGTGTALGGIALSGYGNTGTGAGTIIGGTIVDAGGGIVAAGGVLDGVTYDGPLDLSNAGAGLGIADGITLHDSSGAGTGTILLTGAGSDLYFSGSDSETLGDATLVFGARDTVSSYTSATLSSSLAIEQADNAQFAGAGIIVNDTTLAGSSGSGVIAISTQGFTNAGSFSITGGEQAEFSGDVFTNTGVLTIGAGSIFTVEVPTNGHLPAPVLNTDGVVDIEGGTLSALLVSQFYPVVVTNAAGGDVAGFGLIDGLMANYGTVEAAGGTLTVQQAVSGQGILQADAGATLVLAGGASASETAAFAGAGATLAFSPLSFLGPIGGFASGETIDLLQTAASAASFLGDTIVVTLSAGGSLVLDTTTALSGSITVTAGNNGDTLLTLGGGSHVPEAIGVGWTGGMHH